MAVFTVVAARDAGVAAAGPGGRLRLPAQLDLSMMNAKPAERRAAARIARWEEFRGRTFRYKDSSHPSERDADWVDNNGKTYDAIGDGTAAGFQLDMGPFTRALYAHLLKHVDYTVLDMTGYSLRQKETVRRFLLLPPPIFRAVGRTRTLLVEVGL
jgi:hypothetical protein